MADDNLDQRLARIEAALPTLATKEELHNELVRELTKVATNIDDLRTEVRTRIDALHVEIAGLTGMIRPLAEGLSRWPDLFSGLSDRVRRLEDRQPE